MRVQWIGTGELGVVFFYPADEPPPEDKRVTRVWFTPEVRGTASGISSGCLCVSFETAPSWATLSRAYWVLQGAEHLDVPVEYRGVEANESARTR